MNKLKELKKQIYSQLLELTDKKIDTAKKAIDSAKESRDNDTKSSAGDKYETGRAMMQIEMDKNEAQYSKAMKLKRELSQINIQKDYNKAEFGSLVVTNHGKYFISIGIGKIEVNKENYYCISIASPIGKLLLNKEIGDKVQFQDREFTISDIL
ncbi:MAG: 3-oxoacyl-ACP synthase [Bacteroidetes bacterium]|nr:MAG: 3-oxoacyl-ACP synthase [Bacteroidota bacterium]RLD80636.1 MAG: 3-oxoacyl-ACP synthase [Bacteroidota bacterium]